MSVVKITNTTHPIRYKQQLEIKKTSFADNERSRIAKICLRGHNMEAEGSYPKNKSWMLQSSIISPLRLHGK